jgi:hypothetical protein
VEQATTFFGTLPIEQEREIAKELLIHSGEVATSLFLPLVIFDKEKLIWNLKTIKNKLNELGI